MSNLTFQAETELTAAGYTEAGGETKRDMRNLVLSLIDLYEKQKSWLDGPEAINLFSRLANYQLLGPIMGTSDEWFEFSPGEFQNKRCSSVFKNGVDGRPYYLYAIMWEEKGSACGFIGTVNGGICRQFIKLPFVPKTFCVKVDAERNIIDKKTFAEALDYYDQN